MMRSPRPFILCWLLVTVVATASTNAQNEKPKSFSFNEYTIHEFMVPMRDGVKLKTFVVMPKALNKPLPFLMLRTPYGAQRRLQSLNLGYRHLVESGYIFVFQDLRGRYGSEGEFVMMRPPAAESDQNGIDEGSDANDTIDWLLKNVDGHNGNVGVFGISYSGWTTVQAMIDPHPAIKAASPQASPEDMFLGDDFSHNGAFRLAPSFGYAAMMESGPTNLPFKFDQYDAYEFFLDLGPLSNANQNYFKGRIPSWNNFMAHPNYDQYWKGLNVNRYVEKSKIPALNVAGWWDAEDFYGPLSIYDHLETTDQKNQNFLVIGPWRHGGWASTPGQSLWEIDFGSKTSQYFKEKIEAVWFAHHLKGLGQLDFPEAQTFQTGSNKWESHKQWPPTNTINRKLYFADAGNLSFTKPESKDRNAFDSYVSDPAKPVPYTKRPIKGFWQGAQAFWKVEDQRFVHQRPDVLSWETEPLKEDLVVTGNIIAQLFASTTNTDADWIVKLIDVYPEDYQPKPSLSGYQLMIADEVLRAKFRNSFEEPEPVNPNEIVNYSIDLNCRNHCFKKGHRIMVQLQSTWFPLIDRNPQTYVDIPQAVESDFQSATHKIFRSHANASHLVLPIVQ